MSEESESTSRVNYYRELIEIVAIAKRLVVTTQRVQEEFDAFDINKTQMLLQEYAASLAYVPKILQLLHDYQRFTKSIEKEVQQVLDGLSQIRHTDSLTSEEERVLGACACVQQTVNNCISGYEQVLKHIRKTSPVLLELIAYEEQEFTEFAKNAKKKLSLEFVHGMCYEQHQIVFRLHLDLQELTSMQEHVKQLQS